METTLSSGHLFRRIDSAARAREVFSLLRMWDTAENNGVLLYVLLAERKIEIVADRGFAERGDACRMGEYLRRDGAGVRGGSATRPERWLHWSGSAHSRASTFLPHSGDRNELPDTTALL